MVREGLGLPGKATLLRILVRLGNEALRPIAAEKSEVKFFLFCFVFKVFPLSKMEEAWHL